MALSCLKHMKWFIYVHALTNASCMLLQAVQLGFGLGRYIYETRFSIYFTGVLKRDILVRYLFINYLHLIRPTSMDRIKHNFTFKKISSGQHPVKTIKKYREYTVYCSSFFFKEINIDWSFHVKETCQHELLDWLWRTEIFFTEDAVNFHTISFRFKFHVAPSGKCMFKPFIKIFLIKTCFSVLIIHSAVQFTWFILRSWRP